MIEKIHSNIDNINLRLKLLNEKCCFNKGDVFVLPVSKNVDVKKMEIAIDRGFDTFGESRVQDIQKKYEYFNSKIKFHMIGRLQTNKVKYIIDKVELIHSLDRISLLDKLEYECKKRDLVIKCLVEVNISKEDSKSGIFEENLNEFLDEVSKRERVLVCGLMTIAPYISDLEKLRGYFSKMRYLFDLYSKIELKNVSMEILSMGMSNDFEIAIEEGSNLVRIGTSFFE